MKKITFALVILLSASLACNLSVEPRLTPSSQPTIKLNSTLTLEPTIPPTPDPSLTPTPTEVPYCSSEDASLQLSEISELYEAYDLVLNLGNTKIQNSDNDMNLEVAELSRLSQEIENFNHADCLNLLVEYFLSMISHTKNAFVQYADGDQVDATGELDIATEITQLFTVEFGYLADCMVDGCERP